MNRVADGAEGSQLVLATGLALFLLAVVTHGHELLVLDRALVPGAAFLLDGLPALGLAYAGHRLGSTDLDADGRDRAALWTLLGAALFVAVIGLTFLIRWLEGRVVSEPAFPLLIAAEAGGIAGLTAGYYQERARSDARRARQASNVLEFVNFVIRHDLRNDLSLIRAKAELLQREGDEPAGQGDLETIVRKTEEAVERIETSQAIAEVVVTDSDLETVDLAALSREAVDRLAEGASVSLRTDIPDTAPVRANAGLRSILDNLLENAVEHSEDAEPTVECSVSVDDERVRLTVADEGPGMPPRARAALLGEADSREKTGGIDLVNTLVSAYDGEIGVEENHPQGTRITVVLRRAEGVEA